MKNTRLTKIVATTLVLPAVAVVLSACGVNNRYCLRPQPYDNAPSIPVLRGTGDLKIPQVAGAFVVPPPVKDGVPFGKEITGADGKSQIACLDQPPPMPAPQGDSISVPTPND
ncbi:MAG TPA: hypothetical protein VFQ88_05355 [Nevskiaceae bacterium]|nr:hypothetical protein [Nevskiaceae bacterium]